MHIAKLGKKGQVSIPKPVLERLGLRGEATLAVEVTEDGAILLRQVGIYPLEMYSAERLKEFEEADRITPAESRKVAKRLR